MKDTAHTRASETQTSEQALRQSEEFYHTIVEQVTENIFVVDLDTGRILEANAALRRSLGYTPEELRRLTLYDIVAHDRESIDRNISRVMEEGRYFIGERKYRRKDGSLMHVEANISTISLEGREAMCVVAHDLTEYEQAEETRAQLGAIGESSDDAIIGKTLDGIITSWNTGAEKLYGYSAEEVVGKHISILLPPDRPDEIPTILSLIRQGERINRYETVWIAKDGRRLDIYLTVSPIKDPADRIVGASTIARDMTKRKRTEENLHQSLGMLLALQEAGQILSSTLNSEEILSKLLEIMRRVSNLVAAVISLPDENGSLRVWRSVGLERLASRARYMPEAEAARSAVLANEERHLFWLQHPDSGIEYLTGLCLPLRGRDRTVGVLEAYGPESLAEGEMVEILSSLTSQAASALENAQLYEELGKRERRLQNLVQELLTAQEKEQRRVAYEVHDGLAQVAAAAHQHLQAFSRRHLPSTQQGQRDLERVSRLVRRTVSESRKIIAGLRPTALDDFGLAAAISLEIERFREEGYQVHYEEKLGDERLSTTIEIALFRIAQEALANVRKHAQTRRIGIELRRSGDVVYLEVRDFGRGFDQTVSSVESGPGERVGLAGMRERVSALGGKLEIDSRPGVGTSVSVIVPVVTSAEEA